MEAQLEQALLAGGFVLPTNLTRERMRWEASSRTDAGVHSVSLPRERQTRAARARMERQRRDDGVEQRGEAPQRAPLAQRARVWRAPRRRVVQPRASTRRIASTSTFYRTTRLAAS